MSLYEQLRDKNKLNKDKGLNELSIIRVISNTHGGYRVKTIYKTAIANNKVYTIPGDKLAQIIMNGLFYVQNFSMCINCKDAAFMKFVPSYKIEGYNAKTLHIDIDKLNTSITSKTFVTILVTLFMMRKTITGNAVQRMINAEL